MSTHTATKPQSQAASHFSANASGLLQRQCACGNHTVAGGECEACRKKRDGMLQPAPASAAPVNGVPPIVHDTLRLPGQLPDAATRAFLESRFGRDLSRIPTHSPAVGAIQTKLAINKPGDEYEQEADRVADQVMTAPAHSAVSGAALHIQRFTGQPTGQTEAAPASVDQALASLGRSLEPTLRQDMEQRFGYDFSRVRVHSGAAAEQSVQEVSANAYTVGHNIVFGAGRFAPGTHEGRRLIAHELTHVVQQRQGPEAGGQTGTLLAQRQPKPKNVETKGKAPSKQTGLPAPSPTRTVNDPGILWVIDLNDLGVLYASSNAEAALNRVMITSLFTAAWIQGAGRKAIQTEITWRIADASEKERIAFLNVIDGMHLSEYDSSRVAWLHDQVGAALPLTPAQRAELRRIAGDRISMAYTDFSKAADANAASIKAAATAKATIASVFLDVLMGLAAPGLAKGIAALASKIPATASNLAYRVKLQGLDEKSTERLFAAATKVGKEAIKTNAQALFGETNTDIFLRKLMARFREGIDAINRDLPNWTDEELGVVFATYDPDVSNVDHYIPIIKDLVSRFQRQVDPIGSHKLEPSTVSSGAALYYFVTRTQIVWALVGSALYLVLIDIEERTLPLSPRSIRFKTFIDTDFKDAAIAKQPRIEILPAYFIGGFPSTIPKNAARK